MRWCGRLRAVVAEIAGRVTELERRIDTLEEQFVVWEQSRPRIISYPARGGR